jgi:hypothetical protein
LSAFLADRAFITEAGPRLAQTPDPLRAMGRLFRPKQGVESRFLVATSMSDDDPCGQLAFQRAAWD